ncbi:MAG TPA: malectin domain-containing carbohydrate-binding protein [Candidatus Dormibacteraeota bacterium]|nr:malectin domain-containing carbohydrate-binding protein [Candidatus Dormibacteraeota bacterium]
MPSTTAESVSWEEQRAELQAVLRSPLFARSPTLSHLLSYLCEKTFAGETDQIKEYSVAVDVFDRQDSFDQDTDSIVRVQANRLRKRLSEYYAREGAAHLLRITIPVGQYVPSFQRVVSPDPVAPAVASSEVQASAAGPQWRSRAYWLAGVIIVLLAGLLVAAFLTQKRPKTRAEVAPPYSLSPAGPAVGLPVGEEVHILAGSSRKYVDHAGKIWDPDAGFSGGSAVASAVQHISRTQDPIIYRSSRQGDFAYNIPLTPGTYELRLHFAETLYGPENSGGGGEGSRTMTVSANGQPLLRDFDVLADAGGERTAEVKVFHDMSPASDGQLHLSFSSGKSGSAMLSAIEILPGVRGQIRPVRIVARDVPYYSNDSRWWSPDAYFKGGQISSSQEPAEGTDDPEFYETERWGHFSYAIPVAPGKYTVTLYFIEHHAATERAAVPQEGAATSSPDRVFNVFCNGKTVLAKLNILDEAGENHPLVRKIKGLEPNAQGKLLLEFVPVTRYATVSAIEVVPE